MATSEAGMTSEQEMTDTAEEGETPMDTSDPHSPFNNSEDSNSTHNETEETESAVSTDRDNWSTSSMTPTVPNTTTPTTPTTPRTPTTPVTPGRKEGLPHRPGIAWRKGEKVEAMDYLNKWYPAKIMDVDEEEKQVLIHFEGWNQRYDEWTLMTSEGIRPLTRHSERKERGRKQIKEFQKGEKVLAKWTDCKMYPAKITAVHCNGSLEVVFYDGFQKTVQPINVKPLQEKKKSKTSPSSKEVKKSERQVGRRLSHPGRRQSSEKVRSSSVEERDGKGSLAERRHKHKLIVAGSFLAKRERSHSAPSLSERQKKSEIRRRGFGMRTSPVKTKKEMSLRTSPGQPRKAFIPKLSPGQAKKDVTTGELALKRAKKRALSLPAEEGAPGLPQAADTPQTPSSAPVVPAKRAKSTEKDKSGLAPKEFVIAADHNLFKCMIAGCTKSFRKENLLDYHLKYYHMDEGRTPQPPASRTKRRKTSSICSTDSDISVSSKGRTTPGEGSGSKRKRHISSTSDVLKEESFEEIKKEEVAEVEEEKITTSTPATPVTPVTPVAVYGGKTPGAADVSGSEEKGQEETEDELAGDEVVNCVCGYNEENGLMIQCDVCLCWQHASCFSIKFEALPSKYICFVCENPPGIRDSRRYIHDQEWFKCGHLPSFNFLDVKQSEENYDTVKSTHGLIADVLNVKAVLHSLKQEIKVPSNKNHREMKTWKRICEERRRKSRAAETQSVADITVSANATSSIEPDKQLPDVSKKEPPAEEPQNSKPVVKFCLDTENVDELKKVPKEEESPISKSMGCQASLDLSGSSLDRSDDKSFDMSVVDNDSDTSTMTASESSVGYSSCLPSGQSASGLGADEMQTAGGETEGEGKKMEEEGEEEKEKEEGEGKGNVELPVTVKEEDPADEVQVEDCERSLLLHIVKVQSEMNDRLDLIEEQISALEKADSGQQVPPVPAQATQGAAAPPPAPKSVLRDVPVLKRSLHSLIRDLGKVKSMAAYH